MFYFYLVVLSYSVYRSIRGNYRVYSTFKWLLRTQKEIDPIATNNEKYNFVILIPVLREQEVAERNFATFSNLDGATEVIYITTQKEDFEEKEIHEKLMKKVDSLQEIDSEDNFIEQMSGILPHTSASQLYRQLRQISSSEKKETILSYYQAKEHTRDVLEKLASKTGHVSVMDYPNTDGAMAHQLNYACKKLYKNYDPHKTFVLIYNADSRVSRLLIPYISGFLNRYPEAKIVQQSALFLDNFNKFKGALRRHFLQAIALLQTRWTLAHELPRIINQAYSKIGKYTEGAHVVGHGLCVRLDILNEVGYFPTSTINEDLPLGYFLRLNGNTIYPLPLLENTESPTTVKSMFTQYKTWFYGVLHYPQYLKNVLLQKRYAKTKALIWALKYSIRAVIWLLTSFVWLFLFIYPLVAKEYWLFLLSMLTFIIYAPLSFFVIERFLKKRHREIFHLPLSPVKIRLSTYGMTLPAYLTHSLGPILALKETISSIISGRIIHKGFVAPIIP